MLVNIVCEDEKYMPAYANDTDACMDIKLKVDTEFGVDEIKPHSKKVFGTGIQVAVPEDYVMLVYPRSSTGFKLNCMLANTTGVIDAGYRDEIKIALYNYGEESVSVEDGQRVAQFIIIPRPKLTIVKVKDDENFRNGDRKGGIGSTGK